MLRNVAAGYRIKNDFKYKFQIIAYERAADAVEHLTADIKDIADEGKLEDIPGVGPSIAQHLAEIVKTGQSKHFEEITSGIPPAVFELMKLKGVGPKTALAFSKSFGISKAENAIAKLKDALKKDATQTKILKAIDEYARKDTRMLLSYADGVAEEVVEWLKKSPAVLEVNTLGSIRRRVATVGDIDIAVASNKSQIVIDHFCKYPKAKSVLEQGDKTASVILGNGLQIDLMLGESKAYGALLAHFTGSKHHNIKLREHALKLGYSLSEYGIKNINDKKENDKKVKVFNTEEKLHSFLGMDYIEPELREGNEEIEVAIKHRLPKLVELADIKGDLQIHSNIDVQPSHDLGQSSLREIVDKANKLGYEYVALTDHNPSFKNHTPEQVVKILKNRMKTIEEFNTSLKTVENNGVKKLYNSLEVDILPSGKLALPDEAFDYLDFILVSIHSVFDQSREVMTKRLLTALSYPKVKILAHPTARKITKRESVEADWLRISEFCAQKGIAVEINADPMRLDLPDFLVKEVQKSGVMFSLGTDSHHVAMMDNMAYGVAVARRGWLTADRIMNTLSFNEFDKIINVSS